MREQILKLLAQGLGKAFVLSTLGISEELFAKHTGSEGFTEELTIAAKACLEDRIALGYEKMEERVLKTITSRLDEFDAAGLCRVLETTAKVRQQRSAPANHYGHPTASNQITLVFPQAIKNTAITLDSTNQVIAIGDRPMAPMPLEGVQSLFNKFKHASNDIGPSSGPSTGETYEAASVA